MSEVQGDKPILPDSVARLKIDQVMKLSDQYGGQQNIPLDELEQIGYTRMELLDGGTKVRPLNYVPRVDNTAEFLRKKKEKAPFGEISVQYSGTEANFRFFDEEAMIQLRRKYQGIDFLDNFERDHDYDLVSLLSEYDETSPLIVFKNDFIRYLQTESEGKSGTKSIEQIPVDDIEDWVFKWISSVPLIGSISENLTVRPLDEYSEWDDERGNIISKEKSHELYNDMDRAYGVIDDVSIHRRTYHDQMDNDLGLENFPGEYPEMESFIEDHEIRSSFQFMQYFFARYLRNIGQSEFADQFNAVKSIQEATQLVEGSTLAQKMIEQEKRLRRQIKDAPVEEKRNLSGELKRITDMKKRILQIQLGMKQFLTLPEYISGIYHRAVKNVQNDLVGGGSEQTSGFLYLDGTPNDELDADPGKVSGDCTQGMPLPFDRPEVPAYNVKVFDKDREHIGNMYLLVTQTVQGEGQLGSVWHFDAIQIPRSSIEWESTIGAIIDSLSTEALKKGIHHITVNEVEYNISNYDYIQEGVDKYWKAHGSELTDVDMLDTIKFPKHKKYSEFQGTGCAKILWSSDVSI